MYLDYFGLKEAPFSIAPDPRYLYMSERHREALAHLLYGVSGQGGFVVLTGEVGTGKTTICRCFLNQVPKNTDVAFIINPKLSARELMATICDELHINYPESASIKILNDVINRYLLAAHADNRHTVLIIDEAQNLRVDVLEQLRLLTNLETSEKKLLQIILLGQPELRVILAQNELRQLAQRITARYHLHELSHVEVSAYVQCRLGVAGRRGRLFSAGAIKKIFKLSEGIPRLINLIADRALLGAYASQSEEVEAEHIKSAFREIQGEKIRIVWSIPKWLTKFAPVLVTVSILTLSVAIVSEIYVRKNPNVATTVQQNDTTPIENTTRLEALKSDSDIEEPVRELATYEHHSRDESFAPEQPLESPVFSVDEEKIRDQGVPILPQITGLTSSPRGKHEAYQSIFDRWGVDYLQEPFTLACDFAESYGLRCLHKNGNWRSLLKIDRPAVLTLVNEVGENLYFGLLAIDGQEALVSHQNTKFWVALDEIDRYWLGEYSIVWKLPPYMSSVVRPGQEKEAQWLRTNLAQLNQITGQQRGTLDSQVRQFQLGAGLVPDGIVGSMTIIHMNSQLNIDCPKLLSGA